MSRSSKAWTVLMLLFNVHLHIHLTTGCTDDPPPNPLNSRLLDGAIVCDEGYELYNGPAVPRCTRDGDWSYGQCLHRLTIDPTQYNYSTVNKSASANANTTCSTTLFEQNPSLRLDLHGLFDVYRVDVEFGDATTTHDVEVRVGNNSMGSRNPLCAWETRLNSTFQCTRPLNGHFVYIQLVGDGKLSICNASVYIDRDPVYACRAGSTPSTHVAYNDNKCYTIHSSPISTQPKALEHCVSRNSSLLASTPPNLKSKLDALKPTLGPKQLFWTSATRDPSFTSRTWRWNNNTVIRKPPWGPNQPNNYNGEQNCVVLDGMRDWLWNDVGCGLEFGFVCEASTGCGSPDAAGSTHVAVSGQRSVYTCVKAGYGIVDGDKERVCGPGGEWSGTAPKCKFIDCGPLSKTIRNGSVLWNTTYYGSVVKYTCDEDHILVGPTTKKCELNGKWDGDQDPECLLSHCPALTPPSNSTISMTGQTIGSITSYKCNEGSVLVGSESRTCTLGGKWNGTEPLCKYVECRELGVENGGTKSGRGTLGEKRGVTCNAGYWFVGSEYTCGQDGSWSGDGKCEVITCPDPEVPPGSIVTGYEFKYGSVINYTCEEGHLLVGPSTRRCNSEGAWSGRVPECKYINCGYSPPPPNTQLQYPNSSTHLDSVIVYSCPPNFKLVGPRMRTCNVNGKWSGPDPHCDEIRCKAPSLPPHGVITSKGNDRPTYLHSMSYKFGALIRFHCERGYKVVGPKHNYTCNEDGNWSPSEFPSCEYVDCGQPPELPYASYRLTSNTTVLGSLLIYECNGGYRLTGRERHLCSEEGRWEPGLLNTSCDLITCAELDTEFVKYVGNSRALLECPRGYVSAGKTVANCGSNGEWSELGYCLVKNCSEIVSISNARLFSLNASTSHGHTHGHGAVMEVHCLPGFNRVGEFLLKCEDGQWTEPRPRCVGLAKDSAAAAGVDPSLSSSSSSSSESSSSSSLVITSSIISVLLLLAVSLLLLYVWWRKRRRKLEGAGATTRTPKPREEPMRVYYEPPAEAQAQAQARGGGSRTHAHAGVTRPTVRAPAAPKPPTAPSVASTLQPHEHYYDNPEPVYEDVGVGIGLRQPPAASITINGVAV